MSPQSFATVLHHFRRLSRFWQAGEDASDTVLLEHFHDHQDREAFAELVERHGPLVLRVCRRILHRQQDVEDAFQATFLILARKSRTVRKQRSVASWLYTVAQRIAWNARSGISRRQLLEQQVPDMRWVEEHLSTRGSPADSDPARQLQRRELETVIEQEVGRLPEKYRAPLILCDLQGRTHTEAAQELGLPQGSVSRHLERGRDLLRERLSRRGVGLGATALAALLAENTQAAVPAAWVQTAAQAALLWASGSALPAGLISARAVTLSQGVLRAMWIKNLKLILLALFSLGLLGGGAGFVVPRFIGVLPSADAAQPAKAEVPAAKKEPAAVPAAEPAKKQDALPAGVRLRFSATEKPKEQQGMTIYMGVKPGEVFFSADGQIVFVQRGGIGGAFGAGIGGGFGMLGIGGGIGGRVVPPGGNPAPPPPPKEKPNGKQPPPKAGNVGVGGGFGGGFAGVGGGVGIGGGGVGGIMGGMGMANFANLYQESLAVWSLAAKKKVKDYPNSQAALLSPSGKSIGMIVNAKNKQVVRIVNAKTGQVAQEADLWQGQQGGLGAPFGGLFMVYSGGLAFTPDGKRMAVQAGMDVRQWDIVHGKLSRGLGLPIFKLLGYSADGKYLIGQGMPGGLGMLGGNPFNPLAPPAGGGQARQGGIVVCDLATHKIVRSFGEAFVSRAVLSPKGTTLATSTQTGLFMAGGGGVGLGGLGGLPIPQVPAGNKDNTIKIQLWDVATGKETVTCDTKVGPEAVVQKMGGGAGFMMIGGGAMDVAFAQDGSIMASCLAAGEEGHVHLWEVRTGKLLAHIKLGFAPQAVALSRDTTLLAAAGGLGPFELRVWDVAALTNSGPAVAFDATQFPVLWTDLAADDLSRALRAERTLSSASAPLLLPLLKDKLKPAQATDETRRLAQLLSDLESDQFKVRDKAQKELARGGLAAAAALKHALTAKHTVEFQKRAQVLLTKLEADVTLSAEQRQQQRAVAVLELLGTAEVRQFLDQLAAGVPEAWLTQEARAARQRLGEGKGVAPAP